MRYIRMTRNVYLKCFNWVVNKRSDFGPQGRHGWCWLAVPASSPIGRPCLRLWVPLVYLGDDLRTLAGEGEESQCERLDGPLTAGTRSSLAPGRSETAGLRRAPLRARTLGYLSPSSCPFWLKAAPWGFNFLKLPATCIGHGQRLPSDPERPCVQTVCP